MTADEIIVVGGHSRAGTSLMMRMLRAAGIPALFELEGSMEHTGMVRLPHDTAWLAGAEGHAVKLMDIGHYTPPRGRKYRVIWMARAPHEQAKSQLKFAVYTGLLPGFDRRQMDRMAASLKRDTVRDRALWQSSYGAALLTVRFEDLITKRLEACAAVQKFIGLEDGAVAKMAALVIERTPKNYPGLMEFALYGGDPNAL